MQHYGRPQTFFPGEGKIFQGERGGQKHTVCLKTPKKETIFLEKVKNIPNWTARGAVTVKDIRQ